MKNMNKYAQSCALALGRFSFQCAGVLSKFPLSFGGDFIPCLRWMIPCYGNFQLLEPSCTQGTAVKEATDKAWGPGLCPKAPNNTHCFGMHDEGWPEIVPQMRAQLKLDSSLFLHALHDFTRLLEATEPRSEGLLVCESIVGCHSDHMRRQNSSAWQVQSACPHCELARHVLLLVIV